MTVLRVLRILFNCLILVTFVLIGGWGYKRVPPMGPFLDPANGIWAVATTAELPERAEVTIPSLEGDVNVYYDDRGVPHIFADSLYDAVLAAGYVVARDRLFQLEIQTRAAAGTLTELVGPLALELDREMRQIGMASGAERNYAEVDPKSLMGYSLRAYAEGINTYIDNLGPKDLPLEYRLLNKRPQKWEPVHTLYLIKRMGYTLTYRSTDRQMRRVRALIGAEAAEALFPLACPVQEPIQPNGQTAPRFDCPRLPPPGRPEPAKSKTESKSGWLFEGDHQAIGSNNWAVMPSRSASGHAILAGDPHLQLTLPSVWYEAHMVVPGMIDVYGVTMPGVPTIIIGFTRKVAWTFTNTGADVIDFYRERLDSFENPTRYFLDGKWHPLKVRPEKYLDRDGSLIHQENIYYTHRGPVFLSDDEALSMRWMVLGEDRSEMFFGVLQAKSVEEWMQAYSEYVAPAQNGLVADTQGSISIRAAGWFPIRPVDQRGDFIRDGTSSGNDWQGYWPPEQQPFSVNPEQGYLASANQQPLDPLVNPNYLGYNWYSPWRAMRINQLLREKPKYSSEDLGRFHTDPGEARAHIFIPAFLEAASRDKTDQDLQTAANLLGQWDRLYTEDNQRAVLFELAMNQLELRTWDELDDPDVAQDSENKRPLQPRDVILACLLTDPSSPWWDVRATNDVVEDRDAILNSSLRSALIQARSKYGHEDAGGWKWSKICHANIYHFLKLPALSALQVPIQGGPSNLNPSLRDGTHGASWRMVVEMSPEIRAWSIYPGGQSGNPVSGRYLDRLSKWSSGQLEPVLFPKKPEDLPAERIVSTLRLTRGDKK